MMNLYKVHIRPVLEYGCCLWNMGYLEDLRLLERIQRKWTKEITGFKDLSYSERLSKLNLFSVKGRLLRADLILAWKIFHGLCAINPADIFVTAQSITRGHQYKVVVPVAGLDIRSRFYSVRVVSLWNGLASDTVSADTLGRFKSLLHRDLNHALYEFV